MSVGKYTNSYKQVINAINFYSDYGVPLNFITKWCVFGMF